MKEALYAVLDTVTRKRGISVRVNGESFRFPARWMRWFSPRYEPRTFQFIRTHCKPGATFLDVGAHLGLFTTFAARIVGSTGKVISFEPSLATRSVLRRTIAMNRIEPWVEVRPEAVADKSGVITFYGSPLPADPANSVVPARVHLKPVVVPVTTLDKIAATRTLRYPCLKIDAEGADLQVLRGGKKVFETLRPSCHLSLHPVQLRQNGGSLEEIWDLLKAYRMSVYSLDQRMEQSSFCNQTDLFDVVLLPAA